MEVCYCALLITPFFLDLRRLLNVHVQLANKMGLKKNECVPVSLYFPALLGNGSANMIPRQRIHILLYPQMLALT
jgi:hypothetical protein